MGQPYKQWELDYIKENYTNTSLNIMAAKLNRTKGAIQIRANKMGCKKIFNSGNSNEITHTTKMLVCRYYYDNTKSGMKHSEALEDIAEFLDRPIKVIRKILKKCKENGNYERYNKFGRV